jgi:hypothetical protein
MNTTLIGGGGAYYVAKELTIMMAIISVSALVLVEGQAWLASSERADTRMKQAQ